MSEIPDEEDEIIEKKNLHNRVIPSSQTKEKHPGEDLKPPINDLVDALLDESLANAQSKRSSQRSSKYHEAEIDEIIA